MRRRWGMAAVIGLVGTAAASEPPTPTLPDDQWNTLLEHPASSTDPRDRGGPDDPPDSTGTIASYKDWRVVCAQAPHAKPLCTLSSALGSGDPPKRAATVVIGYGTAAPDREEIVVTVPLEVRISSDVRLDIGGARYTVPFVTCVASGCAATESMSPALTQAFDTATDGAVVVSTKDGLEERIALSLRGYKAAHKSYLKWQHSR
jgi:invasion protein IalB